MTEAASEIIRQLIADGELNLAIEQLTEQTDGSDYHQDALLIAGQYADMKREMIRGVLSGEASSQRKNALSSAVFDLLDQIKAGIPPTNATEQRATINIQGKNIISGNIENVGGDIRIGDNHS